MERLTKPKIGEPCNGCGICCQIQLCNTGAFLLKKVKYLGERTIKGQCPALVAEPDGRFVCGLIKSPAKFIRSKYRPDVISRTVTTLVGAGNGCDEIGYDVDPAQENALDEMIDKKMRDTEWREKITKAVELLQKF